jgi:TonB family protein
MASPTQRLPSLPPDVSPGHHPVAETIALINNWIDYVPRTQKRLGIFILLALLGHLATFFFVRIDTTRSELRHQPRTQVTLENSAPDEATAAAPEAAFWDRLSDPRLYVLPLAGHAAQEAGDIASEFSMMSRDFHPVPMPAPAEIGNYPFLSNSLPPLAQRVQASLHPARQPFVYQENAAPLARATTWEWGTALASRRPSSVPALPSPVSDTEINPTRLRLAVEADGTVSDVILDQSSQVPDLDQQAIMAAQKMRFQPVEAPARQWGFATVSWYYTPKPAELAPPPAPLAP